MTDQGATEPTGDGVVRTFELADDRNIVQRLTAIMGDLGYVAKDQQNREQGYQFRGIDAFMNALHPQLVKHGVVITPKVIDRTSFERDRRNRQGEIVGVMRVVEMLVEFTFHGIDGTQLVVVTAGEGADVADKATNKAMAGALKYAIMQTFVVPTQEIVDGDATTPEVPSGSREQRQQQAEQQALPPREEIMAKLDEACEALGKSRAELTKKWRAANGIGAATQLNDPDAVSDLVLYRFVVSLQPFVDNAHAQQQAAEPDVPPPSDEERAAAKNIGSAPEACGATEEHDGRTRTCLSEAGHEGDHTWW